MSSEKSPLLTTETLLMYAQGALLPEQHRAVERALAANPAKRSELQSLCRAQEELAESYASFDVSNVVGASVEKMARQRRSRKTLRQAAVIAAAVVAIGLTTQGLAGPLRGVLIALHGNDDGLVAAQLETVRLSAAGEELGRTSNNIEYLKENVGSATINMVRLAGGTFMMGTKVTEQDRYPREGPLHEVNVQPFFISQFEITRAQWKEVAQKPKVEISLDVDPAQWKDDWEQPVEKIAWAEAMEFCARLSKLTGFVYRLPSESEWEYAARAGSAEPFAFGATITMEIVNYDGNFPYAHAPKQNGRGKTVRVGSLGIANAFGLFDMHGNVWEWTLDAARPNYNDAPRDGSPVLDDHAMQRIVRGSSWHNPAGFARSGARLGVDASEKAFDIGLRVVREVSAKGRSNRT